MSTVPNSLNGPQSFHPTPVKFYTSVLNKTSIQSADRNSNIANMGHCIEVIYFFPFKDRLLHNAIRKVLNSACPVHISL